MKPITLLSLLLLLILVSGFRETAINVSAPQSIARAYAPYLATDHQGKLVMCWVQGQKEEEAQVYFATSSDKGKTFSKAMEVPGTLGAGTAHGECAPKIAYRKDGTLMILFRVDEPTDENFHAGDVYMVTSADGGKSWSERKPIVEKNGRSRGFFDVKTLPDGEVGVIWLEGKAPGDTLHVGSAIKFARTNGHARFGKEKVISQNVCQCCKTKLYADKNNGIHIMFRKIFDDGSRDMAHAFSTDNGQNFSTPGNVNPDKWKINGCPHVGPDMTAAGKTLHFTWFTMGGQGGIFTSSSTDKGLTFAPACAVTSAKASHPQITGLPDGTLAIVWDETSEKEGKLFRKIGFQTIGKTGKRETIYLASQTHVVHPVVSPIGDRAVFVAYTQKDESGKKIVYQTIEIQ